MSTQFSGAGVAPWSLLVLSVWGAVGCGTDQVVLTSSSVEAASRIASVEQALPSADAGAADAGGGALRYFIGKYVQSEEGDASHFAATAAAQAADLSVFDPAGSGIERVGYNHGISHGNSVFIPDALTPELSRYDVGPSGELVLAATLSFADVGLGAVDGFTLSIASETKAYLFDPDTTRLIAWDPSLMQLSGVQIELAPLVPPGLFLFAASEYARVQGGRLFLPLGFFDQEGVIVSTSAVAVIDIRSDELLGIVQDSRCPAYAMVPAPSGDLYFYPADFLVQALYLSVEGPRPELCSLRIKAGELEFDPDYQLNLGALVGASPTSGGGVQGGIADGRGGIYISVADEALFADGEVNGGGFYRLWHLDLATSGASELPLAPIWRGGMLGYGEATGPVFAVQPSDTGETTAVVDFSTEPPSAFDMQGAIDPFVQLP